MQKYLKIKSLKRLYNYNQLKGNKLLLIRNAQQLFLICKLKNSESRV